MALRDDILDRLDIVDLVGKYVQLKKTGKNRSGLCPFHREKTPSFTVAEDKQIFKCFGCGKGGNAITFHMEIERLDFRDSVQYLAKDLNIDITQYQKDPEASKQASTEKEKNKLINKRLQSFFKASFSGSPAEKYALEKRKLTQKTIDTFGIGYAPDSHYDAISTLKDKGFNSSDLTKAGVARAGRDGDVYSFFRHRLTFPITNHMGTVVGFGARALDADQAPKYLNTTETPLYDKSKILYGMDKAKANIKDHKALIIVEGYMDVIALHQYGLPIGIATCGTALTQEHAKLIKRHSETLVFAFDNDSAGFDATIRGLKVAYSQDLFPRILTLPEGVKDIDEFLTNAGEQASMETLQPLTQDGFAGILSRLASRFDSKNPVERKKMQAVVFDLMSNIEDYGIFMIYLEQFATQLKSSPQIVLTQYKSFLQAQKRPSFHKKAEAQSTQSTQSSQEILLGALLYKDFLKEHALSSDLLQKEIQTLTALSSYMPVDNMLQTVISGKVHDEEKLLEKQLERERERETMNTDKKIASVIRLIHSYNHASIRMLIKSPSLSHEEKQKLMKLGR